MTTILVIEDMHTLREEIMETLTYEGFDVLGAENGVVGVQMAQTYLPNLIVCDVSMPELDGYVTLIELRKCPETAMIPFIFLTARTEKNDMRRGMQLGADDYLTKPFTTPELLGAIAARLDKYRAVKDHFHDAIKQEGAKLAYLTQHDELTQLPNRVLFHDTLKQALLHAKINHKMIALLFLDIDNFNIINNTLGYDIGDRLFKAVAERLRRFASPCDMVARLRGDEFALILTNITDVQQIRDVAAKVLDLLSKPFNLYGHEVFITTSIGITLYPSDGDEADSLIKNADLTMYYAKAHNRNSYKFFSADLNVRSAEYMALSNSLHRALERNELRVFYQPQVDLKTQKIVGAEALVRWQHPDLGIITPNKFIPIAEETGMILTLGEVVMRNVCEQIRIWQEANLPYGCIAINLSGQHFRIQDNLTKLIGTILKETGVGFDHIEIELTESVIMQNSDRTMTTLSELQSLGLQIAIDDFGTGYSSLSYLKHFPVNTLKIDRCFVQDIPNDPHDAAITLAIIELAHSLSLRVVAEGVETEEQLEFLRQQDCDRFQGYLFSPPLPAEEFAKMLTEGKHLMC